MSAADGIPALLNGAQLVFSLLTVNNPIDALFNRKELTYGVFDDNLNAVVTFDSCLALDYHNESPITDAPLEKGAFISYNKVATPYTTRLTVARGKSESDRAALLDEIEKRLDDYGLYSIITPEHTYRSANIVGIDYRRQAENGVSLIVVDLLIREVRINQNSRYTQGKEPSSASQQSGGQAATQAKGDDWVNQLNPRVIQ